MAKSIPLAIILIVVLLVIALFLFDRSIPEPDEAPVITEQRTESGLVKADVILMQRYKGNLLLFVETDIDVFPAKGEIQPNKNPNVRANFMRLVDDHNYIGSTASQTENGAMLQVLCQKEKLTEGGLEKLPADRAPDKPKKGDICVAFIEEGLVTGRAMYFCLKESDTLKSNYQVIGHLSEGVDKLAKLENGSRVQDLRVERLVPGLQGNQ